MAKLTRRDALMGATAGITIVKPQTAFTYQANSAVAFGIIGTGGRGRYDGTHMVNDGRTRLAAICDVYPDRIDLAKTQIPGADKATVYKDLHQLLAQPGIDAVLITTPVFLHPVHFEAAVQAKKHIYCEKPAGADVAGVKRLLRASQKADKSKTIQFGFQQRFSREYLKAYEYLTSGKLGDVKMLHSYWILGNTPPKAFKSPYSPEDQKIRHWGMWMETSGGAIVEQDCHGVDILNWFARALPTSAYGTGGLRYPLAYGDWDSDHHTITYNYPNGAQGWLISVKHTAGYRDVREQIYGSNHMVEVARTYYKLHGMIPSAPLKNADNLADRSMMEKQESKREITIDAIEAFFTSIIDKKPYNMAQIAADSTCTSILGRMAYQKKREVTWDEMIKSA
jgi:myo-inositol 2-dehydrogenase / D-chiro-inositol 1-dehydrogenase